MNLPELNKISSQQMKKIFPFKYYKKYAQHQGVVNYQTQALKQDTIDKNQNKFLNHKRKSRLQIPELTKRKQYNPKYQTFQAIIELNKQQTARLNKFNKALTMKLQVTPQKKPNTIRSPIKQNFQIADQHVLNRLKAIEDIQYDRIQKLRDKKKQQLQKKQACKFVYKIRSTQISPRKSQQLQSILPNPQLIHTSSAIQTIKQQMSNIDRNKSRSLAQLSKIQAKRKILKQKKNLKSQNSQSQNVQVKKDLILQTLKIKKQVYQMQTISYFDTLQSKKKHKQFLQAL